MTQTVLQLSQRDWPAPLLVTAGEVLRTISPTTVASLVLLANGATTQTEIATAINRDQSTVSSSFQSLKIENADVALVEKSGRSYELTDVGKGVLPIVTDERQLGTELETVDWRSESEKERIAARFAPLHGSRSIKPFLLLNSLASRSETGRSHDTLQSVAFDNIAADVESRLEKIDQTTSKRKLRQIIDRFVERNAVTSNDDGSLRLTEKGQRHADLLNQVAEVIGQRAKTSQNDDLDSPTVNELAFQMRRGRLATSYSLENNDPELVDESHIYHKLKRIDVLDTPNDDWHSYRWLTIENNGTTPTNSIVHKESGDTKITFADMDLAAFLENRDGRQLEVGNLTDYQPAIEQKMAIYFPRPLSPGESLTIYYEISWPNELAHYPESELDQTISLTRYPQGVGELQFGVLDEERHVAVDCQKFLGEKDQRWKCLSTPPESIEADHRSELEPIHGEGYDGYIYTIPSPVYPGYRIAYTVAE